MSDHFYILGTVLFTVYGQIVLKWRISQYGDLPVDFRDKIVFLLKLFSDPYILSGFIAAFAASLCWMSAMIKFDLSYAYPFMGLTYVLNLSLAAVILDELWTWPKICGTAFVLIGIIIMTRST